MLILKKYNPDLYLILVNLLEDNSCDFYIYQYDDFVDKVNKIYEKYISTPMKNGGVRKDVNFRWFGFENFTDDDINRKNNWNLLRF